MEEVPWRSEVVLTPALVAEVLRRQFPSLRIRNPVFLNEGWDSAAFLADGRWVFLFPKRRETEQPLVASMRLLAELHDRVLLPVPCPQHWGKPDESFPFHFVGYRLLPGSPADTVNTPQRGRQHNARRMGEFLAALHDFPASRAVALGIPAQRPRDHAEALLDEVGRLAPRIAPRLPGELGKRCEPFLDGTVERPAPYGGTHCLTHGDLQAEHVLLDTGGDVCGVIDFGDAAISEPTGDYVGLCAWHGWDFTRTAMAASAFTWDEPVAERIRFMARCLGLIGVGWAGWQDQAAIAVRLRFLRNAFEE